MNRSHVAPHLRLRRALACVVLGGLAGACGTPEPTPVPSVLLVTVDTLRADHLGAYGYFRETSPNIDALAREGTVFENVITTMATS